MSSCIGNNYKEIANSAGMLLVQCDGIPEVGLLGGAVLHQQQASAQRYLSARRFFWQRSVLNLLSQGREAMHELSFSALQIQH